MTQAIRISAQGGIATVVLSRPDVRNAFNDEVIAELSQAFIQLGDDPQVRAIVLMAEGPAFCAGADLNWMRRMADYTRDENIEDAGKLAFMLRAIYECPKPTIARVQGDVYAGGMGLVAACDMVVSVDTANYCLSEVKLGLIPATISPYVIRAMGARASHRWFLTAERFDAAEAHRIGFVHAVVPADQLEAKVAEIAKAQGLAVVRPSSLDDRAKEAFDALVAAGVRPEPLAVGAHGRYVRYRRGKDTLYLVLNTHGERALEGPFKLSVPVKGAWALDPMDGSVTPLDVVDGKVVWNCPKNRTMWLWTSPDEPSVAAPAPAPEAELPQIPVPGPWTLTPVTGGPEPLPAIRTMAALTSWSTRADGTDELFCGTMRYETTFDLPPGVAPESVCTLDLGEVKWTARVMLNGRELATLVVPPYAVRVPANALCAKGNLLAVEVANLGRNRIRDLDRRGIEWRKFYIVDRAYRIFNLKEEPNEPSGLMGPVTLTRTQK